MRDYSVKPRNMCVCLGRIFLLGVSSAPIRSSLSAESSNWTQSVWRHIGEKMII